MREAGGKTAPERARESGGAERHETLPAGRRDGAGSGAGRVHGGRGEPELVERDFFPEVDLDRVPLPARGAAWRPVRAGVPARATAVLERDELHLLDDLPVLRRRIAEVPPPL